MSDRMKMDQNHKEIIGRLCSKKIPEVLEQEKKIKVLCDIKRDILGIKRISENLNISNTEIKKLFEECDFEFWKLKSMEELGIQECFVPGEPIDISDESLAVLRAQIDENVRKTEEAALNDNVDVDKIYIKIK